MGSSPSFQARNVAGFTPLGWYLEDLNAHLQGARTLCGQFYVDLKIWISQNGGKGGV